MGWIRCAKLRTAVDVNLCRLPSSYVIVECKWWPVSVCPIWKVLCQLAPRVVWFWGDKMHLRALACELVREHSQHFVVRADYSSNLIVVFGNLKRKKTLLFKYDMCLHGMNNRVICRRISLIKFVSGKMCFRTIWTTFVVEVIVKVVNVIRWW